MSIVAETFFSTALEQAFESLFFWGQQLVQKFESKGDLKKTLNEWTTELRTIKALLFDAEHKQFQDKAMTDCVKDLQDLKFDMEDLLAEYSTYKLRQKEFNANMDQQQDADQLDSHTHPGDSSFGDGVPASMVTRFTNYLSTMVNGIDPRIQERVEKITTLLERLQGQTEMLRILQPKEAPIVRQESSSVASTIIGMDEKKGDIIGLLEGEQGDKNYVVIPIVGMGGVGKTTLAKYAYNYDELHTPFQVKAWVWVSDAFDVKHIIAEIYRAAKGFIGPAVVFSTLEEAQKELFKALEGKKLLIVLDDIWNEEFIRAWNELQTYFQHAASGIKLIMTTRNWNFARMMMNTNPSHKNIIHLKGLSDEDCWRLFQHHANNGSDLALRDVIIKKCKGLPLAARELAVLLKKAVDMKERRMKLENDAWSMETSVLTVLRLSYDSLPSHLKQLLAYCSVLPKDYKFTKMEVILLWMAQGLLPENKSESMEDLGHSCFNDLVSRSFIERCSDAEGMFIMHDLVHELARWAAGEIFYVTDIKDMIQANWRRIRHVCYTQDVNTIWGIQLPKAHQLRTLYVERRVSVENLNFIKALRHICTLRLASDRIEVLPEYIGDLKLLRLLNLEFERIKELPKSISNLLNLQTLFLDKCFNLKEVPNIGSLKKLRHLKIGGTSLKEMPMGFEKLTSLRTLDEFILGPGSGARIRELKDLNHLEGELIISGLENVFAVGNASAAENAREAQLYKKSRLDKLSLRWGGGEDEVDDSIEREVVEQLKPHSSIKECKLEGYRGLAFPAWLGCEMNQCTSLQRLTVIDCPKIKRLPEGGLPKSLKALSIRNVGCESGGCTEQVCRIPEHLELPSSLSGLEIEGFQNLESIGFSNLPNLRRLHINRCPQFSSFEDTPLPRQLQCVDISECDLIRPRLKRDPLGCIRMDGDKWSLCSEEGPHP